MSRVRATGTEKYSSSDGRPFPWGPWLYVWEVVVESAADGTVLEPVHVAADDAHTAVFVAKAYALSSFSEADEVTTADLDIVSVRRLMEVATPDPEFFAGQGKDDSRQEAV